ncbi:MAG: tRNA (guanine-N(7)-)-methyltransferase non-catalytic subunit trm82 [Sclerophora amabilis]|nr:MAG: tRNA (guanine-N(7)-)-methyltransferase non-catalytic subunit trm82 [Sclerophora amabilis]
MHHPFQCVQLIANENYSDDGILLAASGPQLYSFSSRNGSMLHKWWPEKSGSGLIPSVEVGAPQPNVRTDSQDAAPLQDREESHPEKRRKVSLSLTPDSVNRPGTEAGLSQPEQDLSTHIDRLPYFTGLAATSTGSHAVTITGENKCLRVFAIEHFGQLRLLSERIMPKRPCALAITADDSTILCGDKFGDVYSLPLVTIVDRATSTDLEQINPATQTVFRPAADEGTVHTARNQRALQNQRQTASKAIRKRITEPSCQLLLGHVSLLTDLAAVSFDGHGSRSPSKGNFIITSDRDEHIRVSRGLPQTHVIEGYCLGHKEFVSRICVPPWQQTSLISGGGDSMLILWDWTLFRILQVHDLHEQLAHCVDLEIRKDNDAAPQDSENCIGRNDDSIPPEEFNSASLTAVDDLRRPKPERKPENENNRNVSGIWAMEISDPTSNTSQRRGDIFVALEGVPILFAFHLDDANGLQFDQALPLKGNVLDVATHKVQRSLFVSVDNIHARLSTIQVRDRAAEGETLLQSFYLAPDVEHSEWIEHPSSETDPVSVINKHGSFELRDEALATLHTKLYTLENLRKQANEE